MEDQNQDTKSEQQLAIKRSNIPRILFAGAVVAAGAGVSAYALNNPSQKQVTVHNKAKLPDKKSPDKDKENTTTTAVSPSSGNTVGPGSTPRVGGNTSSSSTENLKGPGILPSSANTQPTNGNAASPNGGVTTGSSQTTIPEGQPGNTPVTEPTLPGSVTTGSSQTTIPEGQPGNTPVTEPTLPGSASTGTTIPPTTTP